MNIVFCLPGGSYMSCFFDSWMKLVANLSERKDVDYTYRRGFGSNVSLVRERCLRPLRVGTIRPKVPFFDEIPYDYIMWIDSDIMFEPHHFWKLIDDNVDIAAGLYRSDIENYSVEIFKDRRPVGDLVEAKWVGFGFVLIKKGVFEKMEPPWFQTRTIDVEDKKDQFITEDIYFCQKARDAGFKVWVDTKVVVGHQKLHII
jgi:hypothetical protein